MKTQTLILTTLIALGSNTEAEQFQVKFEGPTLDRWMYPHNTLGGERASASTFGSFSSSSDTRNAQFLLGFSTSDSIPSGLPATNYLIRSVRVRATVDRGGAFVYDPTHDIYNTYQPTNRADYLPDADAGRPIELFGVGFRNGYTAANFVENSPFGTNTVEGRNAYAVSYDSRGEWVDVSNNAAKTNSFEAIPFAVGVNGALTPGELVPVDSAFTFELNLSDPFVLGYAQRALKEGVFEIMVSSLHTAAQGGSPIYPTFYNKENLFGGAPGQLEITGMVVREVDTDADRLPDDWEQFYFGNLDGGASGDNDGDGRDNMSEFLVGTDPADSGSGLAVKINRTGEGGRWMVEFTLAAERKYEIQFSEDLVNWSPVADAALVVKPGGVAQWVDESSGNEQTSIGRFYRVNVK